MRSVIQLVSPTPTKAQIIDEFGELDRRVQEFAPVAKRYKLLQDLIRSWYVDQPAESPFVATGALYDVQVGARGSERYFDLKTRIKIFAKLGKAKALELFTITLKLVEENLGKPEFEALVSHAPTGSRKLVAVMKVPACSKAA